MLLHVDYSKLMAMMRMTLQTLWYDESWVQTDTSFADALVRFNVYAGFIPNALLESQIGACNGEFGRITRNNQHTSEVYTVLENTVILHQRFDFLCF